MNKVFWINFPGTEIESCHCEQSEAISRLYGKIATHPSVLAMT